jgi:hypothetical protein
MISNNFRYSLILSHCSSVFQLQSSFWISDFRRSAIDLTDSCTIAASERFIMSNGHPLLTANFVSSFFISPLSVPLCSRFPSSGVLLLSLSLPLSPLLAISTLFPCSSSGDSSDRLLVSSSFGSSETFRPFCDGEPSGSILFSESEMFSGSCVFFSHFPAVFVASPSFDPSMHSLIRVNLQSLRALAAVREGLRVADARLDLQL